ncbi:hypothetical protein C2S53_003251 [Perilla frutescens var. hirtella]|uniref:Uncharacterized protein n=1 Tax=Perilla frutescens var. hirtella TaxID=608512 RepID=A0AAD4JKA7_PERFH|nr:hypothetical protein C2S53_003251 [Perilla frutescens var. hirtella]
MNNSTSLKHQETRSPNKDEQEEEEEEDQEEDALSLCDFPLNSDEAERNNDASKTHHHRRSSSQPSEYSFEFSSDLIAEYTSHAEDLIHCGKLVPYRQQQQPLFDDHILKSLSEDYDSANFSRRYCDSLPELKPMRSNGSASSTKLTRSSRSLDRKKLRRNSSLVMKSEASDIHRSLSKGLAKSESKPRWYGLMFGLVKLPAAEMDLRDMKNRQVRRNPGSMFPGGGSPAIRSERRSSNSSSWGHDLLRVLSCKNHQSSVAVTASIGLVPQL